MSAPVSAPSTAAPPEVLHALAERGVPYEAGARRLAEYSYDASNYRVPPLAVVMPRGVEDVLGAVAACRATGTRLTCRGGGTSMAGNAVGPGVVLDFSRHMADIGRIDEAAGTVDVGPGVVLAELTRAVESATDGRMTFAPDPSSKNRACIGGAIGNDACGNHSVRYGRTSDHVVEIDAVTADGARLTASETGLRATDPADRPSAARAAQIEQELRDLARDNLAIFRTELGRLPRQVSGYHLEHLLPERGPDIARALVGSEGTCAIIVGARMRLIPRPPSALLVCLGYDDVVDAARDVPTLLELSPAAIEGTDAAIVETMRVRRGPDAVQGLPEGRAWLFVDLDGEDDEALAAQAEQLIDRLRTQGRLVDARTAPDPQIRASLWRVREDGAGLSSRLASGGESWPGWEDSAVAPERLADYLADLRELLEEHGLTGVMYGHFGAGCMHIRITYDLRSDEGREVFRRFTRAAAELVVRHGGSLSGEHGDGRARSALLPLMYSPAMLAAFARFRRIWDPDALLNPAAITDPAPIDADLALAGVPERGWRTRFDLRPRSAQDAAAGLDPWVHAVQGCIGVGRCRSSSGGVMCPSFRATGDEKDSTRGRARVLQEMVRGARTVTEGWRSTEVREALDLCLSCKACSSDCPAGVDMASYKSEFLDHHYRGRLRPITHYSLGWLPRWLHVTGRIAPLLNALLRTPLARVAAILGGVSPKRRLPRFAPRRAWREAVAAALPVAGAAPAADTASAARTGVILFVDTFTRAFRPEVAGSAARVLASTGADIGCESEACCGLTWISTGQLDTARAKLTAAAARLDDGTDRPIVVIEPSCAAALRHDLPHLVGTDQARRVAARVRSFATHITGAAQNGWRPTGPLPSSAVVQTHCHEYAVFGATTQTAALRAVGVTDITEATGCCGVAGNFGFEREHYEVSMKVADHALAPALRQAAPGTPVLTDGFSCTMQVDQLDAGRPGLHLAQFLDPTYTTTRSTEETP